MNKYFLIGIKGAGMTPLARILKSLGNEVVGSDVSSHVFTETFLMDYGIEFYEFDSFDFTSEYIVIIGNSFTSLFSEVKKAVEQGNQCYFYYEYLGMLSKKYNSIAITGTHGKTTTTTLMKNVLDVEQDILYLVGDGNGDGCVNADTFVFEACEYRNHFHSYYPNYAIITNVGHDHRDFFINQEMYDQSYLKFASNVEKNVVVCCEDERAYNLFKDNPKTVFYGFGACAYVRASNIELLAEGSKFDIYIDNVYLCTYNSKLYGEHNILNMLATLTVAHLSGLDIKKICDEYDGKISPKRRFEEYIYEQQIVIDDYAHHPDELKAFIDSVIQKYQGKKIIAVFEPHTVERLEEHYIDFAKQLKRCDEQIILPVVIPLRDKDKFGDNHMKSDIMLKYLTAGKLYDDLTFDYLVTKKDCVVVFIGPTISNYTEQYIEKINLIFNKK